MLQHIIRQHPCSTTWTFGFFYNNHPLFFVECFIITKTSTINKLEATAWTIVTPDNVNNEGDVRGTQSDEFVTKADEFLQHTSDDEYEDRPVIWQQQQQKHFTKGRYNYDLYAYSWGYYDTKPKPNHLSVDCMHNIQSLRWKTSRYPTIDNYHF
jgi:hypothetical protein